MDLCDKVRKSCLEWVTAAEENIQNTAAVREQQQRRPQHVRIDKGALPKLAEKILQQSSENGKKVSWDEEGWHYQPPEGEGPFGSGETTRQERIALYILAMDAINFCFWPSSAQDHHSIAEADKQAEKEQEEPYQYEYCDLACCLTSIASADHGSPTVAGKPTQASSYALSPKRLSTMNATEMISLFREHHPQGLAPPDMDRRCQLWNELGSVLIRKFEGRAMNLIRDAEGSAPKLVQLLFDSFEGFRDCCRVKVNEDDGDSDWNSQTVYFLKRAQIAVGDLDAALDLKLDGMSHLTTFPDYRIPQLLRHENVLIYSADLSDRVDSLTELPQGSREECSIRAATVTAVEWLVDEIRKQQQQQQQQREVKNSKSSEWMAVEVDWYLWQVGEKQKDDLQPHHRVRTIYY